MDEPLTIVYVDTVTSKFGLKSDLVEIPIHSQEELGDILNKAALPDVEFVEWAKKNGTPLT